MFDGSVPCAVPDIPVIGVDQEWRLRVAQFGDGYQQRTLDGINALNTKWSLAWATREAADINAMVGYIIAQNGTAFTYQDPVTGTDYQVWCDSWQIAWDLRRKGPIHYGTLTAEFVQAYGVSV